LRRGRGTALAVANHAAETTRGESLRPETAPPCTGDGKETVVRSEQLRRELLAAQALVVTLDRGGELALALGGGLFVELASAKLGEQAGFFDRALETAQRDFEGLVFADA